MLAARRCRRPCPAALVLALALGACAEIPPVTLTCADIGGVSIGPRDRRIATRGYSVLPPSAGAWCMAPAGSPGIVFTTSEHIGGSLEPPPDPADIDHSFVAGAIPLRVRDAEVAAAGSLEAFLEAWLSQGRGSVEIANEWYATRTPRPGYRAIYAMVRRADRPDAHCLRYEVEYEVSDYPRRGAPLLTTRNEGLLCRHPDDPGFLVDLAFSERHERGRKRPDLRERFRSQAEATLQSLQLSSL